MNKALLLFCITLTLSACAEDYESQADNYWEQAAVADRQLASMDEQLTRSKAQQDIADELIQRQKTQLDRWDVILDRHEKVLGAMEKQYDVVE